MRRILTGLVLAAFAHPAAANPAATSSTAAIAPAPSASTSHSEDPAVTALNAGIIAHQQKIDVQNAAAAAAYHAQLAAYEAQLKAAAAQQAAVEQSYAEALAKHAAAVKACASGDLDQCGGQPVAKRPQPVAVAAAPRNAAPACHVEKQTGSLVKTRRSCR